MREASASPTKGSIFILPTEALLNVSGDLKTELEIDLSGDMTKGLT